QKTGDTGETKQKTGDTGAKTIEIRCVPRESLVRVTVFNTGKPIPEESLPRIWEKFYKVDKARTRTYGGSGVGLSIVKAIMELHHRGYGVENYSNGVAFWFELDQSGPSGERN
ncbi:MAG: ATP-binding protein, partial [Eubacteriales bacterium]|nr:ATP-binding protein [Eubacteriales bacterium]